MKTKLTLNIDDRVIEKVKTLSKKRKQSISAIVEEYLKNFTSQSQETSSGNTETFTKSFRKLFPAKPAQDFDYKKARREHLEKKYGRK
jgi:glutamate synthase domain-containing protein 3